MPEDPKITPTTRYGYQYFLGPELNLHNPMRDHTIAKVIFEKLDEIVELAQAAHEDIDWTTLKITGEETSPPGDPDDIFTQLRFEVVGRA